MTSTIKTQGSQDCPATDKTQGSQDCPTTETSLAAHESPGASFEARMATDRLRCLGCAKALKRLSALRPFKKDRRCPARGLVALC